MSSSSGVGASPVRPDAVAKLTGEFGYATELHAPGELHGATVRSPVAAADLLGVETAEAMRVRGAYRVLTIADVPGARRVGVKTPDQPVLADGRVRHHGEPIAFALAETAEAARRMALLVRPILRPRPALLDPERALDADAPRVGPDGGNLVHRLRLAHGTARRGATGVRRRWRTGRQDAAFLAPEAGLAFPDGAGGVVLRVATQDLHHDRAQIAAALGLPEERVRVELAGVGGAFGGREDITVHVHLCLAALLSGRPVRALYSRAESFGAHPSRHPAIMTYELTADPDGTFVSLAADLLFDGGAYASTSKAVVGIAHYFAAGPYRIPRVEITTRAVYTNNPVAGALRGFGATQVCFAMESTVDALAAELGLGPADVRRRNLLEPGEPLATSGQRLAGVAAPASLLDALDAVPLPAPAPSLRRGVGVAVGIKSAGLGDGRPEGAGIVLRADRHGVEIVTAAPEVGQGVRAVLAQIVTECLGPVPITFADATSALPASGGSKASRQTMASGGAALRAATRLRQRLGGAFPVDLAALGDGTSIVVEERYDAPPTAAPDPRTGRGDPHIAFQLTAHRAVVDVDPALGMARVAQLVAAQDVGRALNPALVRGQLAGGTVQGAGFALLEEIPVDADGRGGAAGFGTYLLPAAVDVPEVIPLIVESGDPRLPFGAKGVGEGPLISSPAAVAAALRAATGRPVARIPAHPEDLATTHDPAAASPAAAAVDG
ncbi:molybdopterin cofactor-binding domain-containing protein [Acrocarpospora sp. B8E8]|uniref:xanthine dehydrogenase family protein molybdopterin-binding subunit n=1 Tax=Acrocarpospora sp. B8E8 TaxID=3153572 RepID=UPI00325FDCAC